ncbi:MAG: SDR family NAD(P)-dependent oxidoreductase, partial [Alcaligenaceae bacterium]
MDLGLKGKSALITGASKGIGLATAHSFAREGVATLHLAARSADALQAARTDMEATYEGLTVHVHPMDLSVTQNVIDLAARCS